MSGLEIAGCILGILGPLQQAIHIATVIKERFHNYSHAAKAIASIQAVHQKLLLRLQFIQEQCSIRHYHLSERSRQILKVDIAEIKNSLGRINGSLSSLQAKCNAYSRVIRFFRASAVRETCLDLMGATRTLSKQVERLQAFALTCETVESIVSDHSAILSNYVETIAEKQQQSLGAYVDQLARNMQSSLQNTIRAQPFHMSLPEERFRPSFHVRQLTGSHWLDFETLDSNFQPVSNESRFKHAILSTTMRRRRGSCISPVVAALGCGGMGTHTVLRGLARDSQIRGNFPGGVYLILLGKYVSERNVSKQLAKIVKQSGGFTMSREMESSGNLLLATDMAIKWFRGTKCLYLVNSVWPNSSCMRAFNLMRRLAEHTGPGSAIAATCSRNSLKVTETAAPFSPWNPSGTHSQALLLRAARFAEAEVTSYPASCWQAFQTVLRLCGGRPLFLRVAGECVFQLSCLRLRNRSDAWGYYLSLRNDVNQRAFNTKGERGGLTLASIVMQAFKTPPAWFKGSKSFWKMLRELWVLQGRRWASYEELQRIWELNDQEQTLGIVRTFSMLCLLKAEKTGVWIEEAVLTFALREAASRGELEDQGCCRTRDSAVT